MPRPSKRGKSDGAKTLEKSPAVELREILRLDNNLPIFEEIRNNIRLIGKEFLDINKIPCRQKDAIVTIRRELAGRYPDLFGEKDRRLDLAEDMVKQQHARARCAIKEKLAKEKERMREVIKREKRVSNVGNCGPYVEYQEPTNVTEPSSSFGSDRPTFIDGRVPSTPVNLRRGPTVPTPGPSTPSKASRKVYPLIPRRSMYSVSRATPSTQPRRGIRGVGSGYESNDSDQPLALRRRRHLRSIALPTPRQHRSIVPPTPRRVNVDVETQPIHAVYHFLDTCVPSMAHLFKGFVEYGCDGEEFLLGISDWPPVLISKFIHNVSRKTGEHISEMETDIIQAQFMTYFKN